MIKKTIIVIVLIILAFLAGLSFDRFVLTGQTIVEIEEDYTWTTAICNSQNECIDVLVECENGDVKGLEPVSDLKKFDENWEDIRGETGELCK